MVLLDVVVLWMELQLMALNELELFALFLSIVLVDVAVDRLCAEQLFIGLIAVRMLLCDLNVLLFAIEFGCWLRGVE